VIIKAHHKVLMNEIAGESVLLSTENDHYFTLNESGTRMYTVLIEQGSIEGALVVLQEEYEVEESVLRRDLIALVEQLRHAHLIVVE